MKRKTVHWADGVKADEEDTSRNAFEQIKNALRKRNIVAATRILQSLPQEEAKAIINQDDGKIVTVAVKLAHHNVKNHIYDKAIFGELYTLFHDLDQKCFSHGVLMATVYIIKNNPIKITPELTAVFNHIDKVSKVCKEKAALGGSGEKAADVEKGDSASTSPDDLSAPAASTQTSPDDLGTSDASTQTSPDDLSAPAASTQTSPDDLSASDASTQTSPDDLSAPAASTQTSPDDLSASDASTETNHEVEDGSAGDGSKSSSDSLATDTAENNYLISMPDKKNNDDLSKSDRAIFDSNYILNFFFGWLNNLPDFIRDTIQKSDIFQVFLDHYHEMKSVLMTDANEAVIVFKEEIDLICYENDQENQQDVAEVTYKYDKDHFINTDDVLDIALLAVLPIVMLSGVHYTGYGYEIPALG